jgi:hypothetical protein
VNIEAVRLAVEKIHGCKAVHASTVAIKETFEGQTIWEGEVEVFNLSGHPRAFQCYAWAYQDDDGQTQYTAVLRVPPVQSPQDVVKAAIRAQVKG